MQFPGYRARRLRQRAGTRSIVSETQVGPGQLIALLRIASGKDVERDSQLVAGAIECSVDRLERALRELLELGVRCVFLAPLGDQRDELARAAVRPDGPLARAVGRARALDADLTVIAELDPASYTKDGHGGVVQQGMIDNDATLDMLAEMALVCARAGADFVAPSASMDGQVGWLREALDEEDQEHVGIVPCSVRYASSFGEDASLRAEGGEKLARAHLLGPANVREAIREATLDVDEGADMLMVRPATPFLDVIARLGEEFELPLVGFMDEREHAIIDAAARAGVLSRDKALVEALLSIRRAGADAIVTPRAAELARALARWDLV